MINADDLGNYFRIPSDNRNLNYDSYEDHGNDMLNDIEEYNSHNTERLDTNGMVKLLKKLGEL